jgi:dTDP-4-amino-4,6-dideoxygalactose transaminase
VVPVVDLSRRTRRFAEAYAPVVQRVINDGPVLLGAELAALETELADWSAHRHVVGLASGAAALELTLRALGIGTGDEVLVPAFTAVPTASAVWSTGATPVFVDVDPGTAAVAPDAWDRARTPRTKAVIVVHLYGRPAQMPNTDLPIIEDAAQAHGALDPTERRSIAVAYSFYPTKNLGGIGDGGAVATDNDELAASLRRRRVHGMTEMYVHTERAQNHRMSELEAGWLRLGLRELAADTAQRRQVVARYRAAAPGLCWQADHERHVYHLAVFRTGDRDAIRARLAEAGVATAIHYPLALTQQPAWSEFTTTPCPSAEAWAASCVTVPCFAEITEKEVDAVCTALELLPHG